MPVSWTPENDRKLLLLMLQAANVKVNYQSVQKAWGPDAPTIKAISLRCGTLKRLTKDGVSASTGTPTKKSRTNGLITPAGSPKASVKRPRAEEKGEPVTPRRAPKRQARKELKYEEKDVLADELDEVSMDESESEYEEEKEDGKTKIEEEGGETPAAEEVTKPEGKEVDVEARSDTDSMESEIVVEKKVVGKEIRLGSPFMGKSKPTFVV